MRNKYLLSRTIIYYLIVLVFLRLAFGPFAWYFSRSVFFADVTSDTLLDLVNDARKSESLTPLKIDAKLNLAAYQKAQDMFDNQYFAHYSPIGKSPWYWFNQVGYQYQYAGENLAIHFFDSAEVHEAWMNSASHRANILNPHYQEMGLAVVTGNFDGQETSVIVQLFGTPRQLVEYIEPAVQEPEIITPEVLIPEALIPEESILSDEKAEEVVISTEELASDLMEIEEMVDEEIPIADLSGTTDMTPGKLDLQNPDLRLLGSSSTVTPELSNDHWFRIFKTISRHYEQIAQQFMFYGIILIFIYFMISIVRRPVEDAIQICSQTTVWILIILFLSLLTKDFIISWFSNQIIIG